MREARHRVPIDLFLAGLELLLDALGQRLVEQLGLGFFPITRIVFEHIECLDVQRAFVPAEQERLVHDAHLGADGRHLEQLRNVFRNRGGCSRGWTSYRCVTWIKSGSWPAPRLHPPLSRRHFAVVRDDAIGTQVRVVNQPFLFGWHEGALHIQAFDVLEDDARDWKKARPSCSTRRCRAHPAGAQGRQEKIDWDAVSAPHA